MDDNKRQCYAAKRHNFLRQGVLLRLVAVTCETPHGLGAATSLW